MFLRKPSVECEHWRMMGGLWVGRRRGTCRRGSGCGGSDACGSGLPPLHSGVLGGGGLPPVDRQPVGVDPHLHGALAQRLRNALAAAQHMLTRPAAPTELTCSPNRCNSGAERGCMCGRKHACQSRARASSTSYSRSCRKKVSGRPTALPNVAPVRLPYP